METVTDAPTKTALDAVLKRTKPKAKAKKAAKPKTKKKPAVKAKKTKRPAPKRKVAKPKAKRSGGVVARPERLDLRLTKAEKAKLVAKSKATRRTQASIVQELIEKLR